MLDKNVTLLFYAYATHLIVIKDISRWTVWLGRHAVEKISMAPKGKLRRVRNPS